MVLSKYSRLVPAPSSFVPSDDCIRPFGPGQVEFGSSAEIGWRFSRLLSVLALTAGRFGLTL